MRACYELGRAAAIYSLFTSTKGIVFFAGKCIYEKGLFWLLLILSGAFFGRNFPSLAPRSGAFLPRKTSLARSKLPFSPVDFSSGK